MKHTTRLLRSQISLLKPFIKSCSLSTVRKWQEKMGKLMSHTHSDKVTYNDFKIGALYASMIKPKDEVSSGVILYLHGGGFTSGSLDYAKGFGTILSAKCGISVLCVAYRLAPENVFPDALNDSLDAYGYLLSSGYSPSQIILCGESAGGGLCYSLPLMLKEKRWSMPAGIIAISPWVDLTHSSSSYKENEKKDPSMTIERLKYFADCYVYGAKTTSDKNMYPNACDDKEKDELQKRNPLISPMFADLSGMPPSLIFVGGDEIMLGDSKGLHDSLISHSSESELIVTNEMWHGYILYTLREYEKDFDKIRKFIKAHIPHQKKLRWMTLDNAAKIFPASRNRHWTNVFRLSATLCDNIDREVLRSALDVTVRRFPSIAVRLKPGFFWYYIEEVPKAPDILDEKPYPLSRMIFDDIRKCAFRVLIYEKRLAIEFFHALTDGNGGLVFLKTLVAEYIYQKYSVKVPFGNGVLDRLADPSEKELEDSFQKYSGPVNASRADTDAFKIKGVREPDGYKTNTTFILDTDKVVAEAKKRGITVTAYLTAAFIVATQNVQKARVRNPKKYKPVKILVPVNLRKLFPSETLRNFVLYASPGIDPRLGEYTFDEICSIVHHQMNLQITQKNMAAFIAVNVNSERPLLLRMAPLFLKNIVLKIVFNIVGERKSCFSFSNLGAVNMPEEFTRYVDRIDFVIGVQAASPYNMSLISYKGKSYLNVIRNMKEPVLERELYDTFKALGLHVSVESNTRNEEK